MNRSKWTMIYWDLDPETGKLAQNIHQSTNGPVPWRETDRERESRERMQQQAVDSSMKEVEWHDTVQVQEVTI